MHSAHLIDCSFRKPKLQKQYPFVNWTVLLRLTNKNNESTQKSNELFYYHYAMSFKSNIIICTYLPIQRSSFLCLHNKQLQFIAGAWFFRFMLTICVCVWLVLVRVFVHTRKLDRFQYLRKIYYNLTHFIKYQFQKKRKQNKIRHNTQHNMVQYTPKWLLFLILIERQKQPEILLYNLILEIN